MIVRRLVVAFDYSKKYMMSAEDAAALAGIAERAVRLRYPDGKYSGPLIPADDPLEPFFDAISVEEIECDDPASLNVYRNKYTAATRNLP